MRNILLVDDEVLVRKGVHALLEDTNLSFEDIIECSNGIEALKIIQSKPIDIAIIDIRMPQMDGIALIREAHQMEVTPLFVILSGYDDFEYAREAIQYGARAYLLKPVDRRELYGVIHKLEKELIERDTVLKEGKGHNGFLNQIYSNELNYILLNRKLLAPEIKNIIDKLKMDLLHYDYMVMVLGCTDEDSDLVYDVNLPMHLEKCLLDDEVRHLYFKDYQNNVVFIASANNSLKINAALKSSYPKRYFMGISRIQTGTENFSKAYFEAKYAFKYRFLYRDSTMIRYEDTEHFEKKEELDINEMKKMAAMIGTHNLQRVLDEIDTLFQWEQTENIKIEALEDICSSINKYVLDAYGIYLTDTDRDLKQENEEIRDLDSFKTLHQYRMSLKRVITELDANVLALKKEFRKKDVLDDAIVFIEKNYFMKDMSMTLAANEVSLNYNYFSSAFKARTGINFVSYLRNLRIEKAKELLNNDTLSVNEVAQDVGFENPRLFTKAFKEIVGIPPSEYQRNGTIKPK